MLRVERLSLRLGDFHLRDIDFRVDTGEYFVILGASGVGKTLLLEAIAGLVTPDDGRISWDTEDLTTVPIQKRRLGLVYQDQALFPHLTVHANIAYGIPRGIKHAERDARVRALADETGVTRLLRRRPGTLSGGEAQRVALARTLAASPRCLLLDEPLSALDQQARANLRGLLRRMHQAGRTIVHVTHDFEEAASLATRVAIMEQGTIVQAGTPEAVFQQPRSEFVARFTGVRNVLRGRLETDEAGQRFHCGQMAFRLITEAAPGPGMALVRSEDIVLAAVQPDTSIQNTFACRVRDVFRVPGGVEVLLDASVTPPVELAALVTPESVTRLGLVPGAAVWAGFKATAVRFVED